MGRSIVARTLTAASLLLAVTPGLRGDAAATAAYALAATGVVHPGYPDTGCASNQTVSFDGSYFLVGTPSAFPLPFRFDGVSEGCGSLVFDYGSGLMTGQLTGNVTYSRTGSYLLLSGWVERPIGDPNPFYLSAPCVFIPTSMNPVQTYALACAWAEF